MGSRVSSAIQHTCCNSTPKLLAIRLTGEVKTVNRRGPETDPCRYSRSTIIIEQNQCLLLITVAQVRSQPVYSVTIRFLVTYSIPHARVRPVCRHLQSIF